MPSGQWEGGLGQKKVVDRRRILTVAAIIGMMAIALVPTAVVGEVVNEVFVERFEATPDYINLGRQSLVEVEISQMHGGTDSYLVVVTSPDSVERSTWLNFTAPGVMNTTLGDPDAGLMTMVDQVGTYLLRLMYYDGANLTFAGVDEVMVTDQLDVVIETRTASNEYTDAHTCPISLDFQRGAEFVGGAFVYYASTGEPVTNEVPGTKDNITGTILGETKVLPWRSYALNYHQVWFFPWDAPVGPMNFTVEASDGLGNTGMAVSGTTWNSAVTIGPAILSVDARVMDGAGNESVAFVANDTIYIEADVMYESHNAHNKEFAGRMKPDRGGEVVATLGWGAFNTTSGVFEDFFTNVTLSYDTEALAWVGSYKIPADTGNISSVQAAVFAHDAAGEPPNSGSAFTTMFRIQAMPPPPAPPSPPPKEEDEEEGFGIAVVGGLAVVTLLVGLGIGMVIFRGSKGGSGADN